MNAPLFLPPRTAPQLAPYWQGLAKHELRLPRCSVCGEWEWYPSAAGPSCQGGHYDWRAVSGGATVFTFTEVERPLLPSVREPYVVGLVCPDDAPDCRIAARLEGPVAIGAPCQLKFSGSGAESFPYYVVEGGP